MLDIYEGIAYGLFSKESSVALVGGFETPVFIYTKGELLTDVGLAEDWDYENFVLNHEEKYCANVQKWDKKSYEA